MFIWVYTQWCSDAEQVCVYVCVCMCCMYTCSIPSLGLSDCSWAPCGTDDEPRAPSSLCPSLPLNSFYGVDIIYPMNLFGGWFFVGFILLICFIYFIHFIYVIS